MGVEIKTIMSKNRLLSQGGGLLTRISSLAHSLTCDRYGFNIINHVQTLVRWAAFYT